MRGVRASHVQMLSPAKPRGLGWAEHLDMAGRAKMGNVNFSQFSIFGVKNKMSFFEAKYVIWKHLDSSVLKISQKSRPKPPVGGKQVRPTPFLLKMGGFRSGPGPARARPRPGPGPGRALAGAGPARAKNCKCQFFTFSDFWGQNLKFKF